MEPAPASGGRAQAPPLPQVVAVIGLGLIGGSMAMGLRAAGVLVIGVDVDPEALRLAREREAIDTGSTELDAVARADMVIVATPLSQAAGVGLAAARRMRSGTVLTDVGSVKSPVVAAMHAGLPQGVRFVGGHPMAGSERQGMASADPRLLAGRPYVLTPTARTDAAAVALVSEIAVRLGMRPMILDPIQHDELVAQVSHLPYLLSVALHRAIADDARAIGGPAMHDMTRIAQSPPALWAEICAANRDAILRSLARFEAELAALRRGVASGSLDGAGHRSMVSGRPKPKDGPP